MRKYLSFIEYILVPLLDAGRFMLLIFRYKTLYIYWGAYRRKGGITQLSKLATKLRVEFTIIHVRD